MGTQHGYGLARRIEQLSGDHVLLNQGTIYASLVRLQQRGWIAAEWGTSETNRRAKHYSTAAGFDRLVCGHRVFGQPTHARDGNPDGDWRNSGNILKLVFKQGMVPLGIGLVAGLAASFPTNRVLESQLVRVSPFDPITLIAVTAVLVFSAVLGCWIPARRAMRADPVVALRHELV